MIKTKSFNTQQEFENWQKNNNVKVHSIQPLNIESTLVGRIKSNKVSSLKATSFKYGIFVVYTKD